MPKLQLEGGYRWNWVDFENPGRIWECEAVNSIVWVWHINTKWEPVLDLLGYETYLTNHAQPPIECLEIHAQRRRNTNQMYQNRKCWPVGALRTSSVFWEMLKQHDIDLGWGRWNRYQGGRPEQALQIIRLPHFKPRQKHQRCRSGPPHFKNDIPSIRRRHRLSIWVGQRNEVHLCVCDWGYVVEW